MGAMTEYTLKRLDFYIHQYELVLDWCNRNMHKREARELFDLITESNHV